MKLRKTRDLTIEDPLDEDKIDRVLYSPKETHNIKDDNFGVMKTINKGRSTSNLSNYENNRALLSTLKKDKLSSSSNMLRPISL